jgi:hypothetical protein
MSYLLKKAKEKVKKLEEELKGADISDAWKESLEEQLIKAKAEVEKFKSLELQNLEQIASEMKVIKGHIKAVDDKYECRTVKFMFAVADFFDRPRSISKSLAKNIREYTITKINAPVCSIVGSPKPELPPMPQHGGIPENTVYLEQRRKDREEMVKFRNISVNYLEAKPSKLDRIKAKVNAFKNA